MGTTDFGSLLDRWIDEHGIPDKDANQPADEAPQTPKGAAGPAGAAGAANAARLRVLQPQASLDLHGMTARDAERELVRFLAVSASRGLEKVLVIHGKGNHSKGDQVLGSVVRRVLESSEIAGSFGHPDRKSGGSGATWAVLRARPRRA